MRMNRQNLRRLIESILNESVVKAHKAALADFDLPDNHPIGELKDGILVLYQEVQSSVTNAELWAKDEADQLGLKQQFFRAKKYFYPDPVDAKHVYFKIEA
mgnify:CR=1 FL=1